MYLEIKTDGNIKSLSIEFNNGNVSVVPITHSEELNEQHEKEELAGNYVPSSQKSQIVSESDSLSYFKSKSNPRPAKVDEQLTNFSM